MLRIVNRTDVKVKTSLAEGKNVIAKILRENFRIRIRKRNT